MPILIVNTNVSKSSISNDTALTLSKIIASSLGKPESYVNVVINADAVLSFGGSTEGCAFVELQSIGFPSNRSKVVKAVTDAISQHLKIPGDRFYVRLVDLSGKDLADRRLFWFCTILLHFIAYFVLDMPLDQLVPTDNCTVAMLYATSIWISIIQIVDILLSAAAIVLFVLNVFSYKKLKNVFHFNFKINMISAAFLAFLLNSTLLAAHLRNQLVYRTFQNPCDLMMVTWVVLIVRVPGFIYVVGATLVHFCCFVERALATCYVRHYEMTGTWLGWLATFFTWSTTLFVNYWLYYTEDFFALKTYAGSTSQFSGPKLLIVHYVILFVDLAVLFGDLNLFLINKKQKNLRIHDYAYSLSKNYQLNENAAALQWLLPLSFVHSACFLVYALSHVLVRQFGENLDPVTFMIALEGSYIMIPIHSCCLLSAMLYREIKKPKKFTQIKDSEGAIYFLNLEKQWGKNMVQIEGKSVRNPSQLYLTT
uniref:Uncharacterized protein n=1 Tax=Panagrolaimus sp. JU765 TaxID=591449 RepID=A0AC34QTX5_9BILA